jgi:hypothetical protein
MIFMKRGENVSVVIQLNSFVEILYVFSTYLWSPEVLCIKNHQALLLFVPTLYMYCEIKKEKKMPKY